MSMKFVVRHYYRTSEERGYRKTDNYFSTYEEAVADYRKDFIYLDSCNPTVWEIKDRDYQVMERLAGF